tara:strand:+ start:7160 stop:7384 length:225 start_codon:yes stop_codon:yes gene_type:complete
MNQQLKKELKSLLQNLNVNTTELNMDIITQQFISVMITYEKMKDEIISNSKDLLTNVFNNLPSDIKNKLPQIKD